MKKYRIVNKTRFAAFVIVCTLLIIFAAGTLMGMFNASAAEAVSYKTVRVEYGDSLWSLAKAYGTKGQDIRLTIYEIEKLNNVSADTLQAGQYITIPCK